MIATTLINPPPEIGLVSTSQSENLLTSFNWTMIIRGWSSMAIRYNNYQQQYPKTDDCFHCYFGCTITWTKTSDVTPVVPFSHPPPGNVITQASPKNSQHCFKSCQKHRYIKMPIVQTPLEIIILSKHSPKLIPYTNIKKGKIKIVMGKLILHGK